MKNCISLVDKYNIPIKNLNIFLNQMLGFYNVNPLVVSQNYIDIIQILISNKFIKKEDKE